VRPKRDSQAKLGSLESGQSWTRSTACLGSGLRERYVFWFGECITLAEMFFFKIVVICILAPFHFFILKAKVITLVSSRARHLGINGSVKYVTVVEGDTAEFTQRFQNRLGACLIVIWADRRYRRSYLHHRMTTNEVSAEHNDTLLELP
jgi:hypothetical protein